MWPRLVVVSVYVVALVLGMTGNLWVLFSLVKSSRALRQQSFSSRINPIAARTRRYIIILAGADMLVLMTIPSTLIFIFDNGSDFSALFCQLHNTIDISGKLLSVVVLACMSIERYLSISTRYRDGRLRKYMNAAPIAFGITVCIAVPAVPQAYFTEARPVFWQNELGESVWQTMCLNTMPDSWFLFFTCYLFVCGFALPLTVMTVSYILLIRHVKRKIRSRIIYHGVQRPRYLCRLTKSICRVAVFHFLCWAPFWLFTVAPTITTSIFDSEPSESEASDWSGFGRMFTNLLPYVNSAGNWIFYAALNRDLRNRRDNKRSLAKSQCYAQDTSLA